MGTRVYVGIFVRTKPAPRACAAGRRKVVSVSIVTDRMTGQPRGFAFVGLRAIRAQSAIAELNGKPLDDAPSPSTSPRTSTARRRRGYGGGGGGGGVAVAVAARWSRRRAAIATAAIAIAASEIARAFEAAGAAGLRAPTKTWITGVHPLWRREACVDLPLRATGANGRQFGKNGRRSRASR